jgi:sec-independent protein translocase protein TatB
MFDVGFSEIVVIAVVALIVIGPERLPKVARTIGHLFGRLQRYVNQVKDDISREMELDELRKLQSSVKEAAQSLESGFQQNMQKAQEELRSMEKDMNPLAEEPAKESPPAETPAALPEAAAPAASSQPASPAPAVSADRKA